MERWRGDFDALHGDIKASRLAQLKDPYLALRDEALEKALQELGERVGDLRTRRDAAAVDPAWEGVENKSLDWRSALSRHKEAPNWLSDLEAMLKETREDSKALASLESVAKGLRELEARLDGLEERFRKGTLEGDGEKLRLALGAGLADAAARRRKLWEDYRAVDLRLGLGESLVLEKFKNGFRGPGKKNSFDGYAPGLWPWMNPVAESFAALRDRLVRLRGEFGLDAPEKRGGVGILGDRSWAGAAALSPAGASLLAREVPAIRLLATFAAAGRDESQTGARPVPRTEQERIAVQGIYAMRAMGLTLTYGDPDLWGFSVHLQDGGTCAVASQVCALRIAGIAPSPPKEMETKLYEESRRLGIWAGWTRNISGYRDGQLGSLLVLNGIPVTRHINAKAGQLDMALRRGHPVLVGVDAGVFYGEERSAGEGHAVLVVGLEADRRGNTLGYYVNDTASGQGARLVPAKQFREAWAQKNSVFAEPR